MKVVKDTAAALELAQDAKRRAEQWLNVDYDKATDQEKAVLDVFNSYHPEMITLRADLENLLALADRAIEDLTEPTQAFVDNDVEY